MNKHRHICVWIDHQQARVFGIGLNETDETIIHEPGPTHHIHRKADHLHLGKAPPDGAFLKAVASALGDARGILILGPGSAKSELLAYLEQQWPLLAGRIWGVHPADHPTDGEIIAEARKFFHAAGRLQA